jgi:hypothetical protein
VPPAEIVLPGRRCGVACVFSSRRGQRIGQATCGRRRCRRRCLALLCGRATYTTPHPSCTLFDGGGGGVGGGCGRHGQHGAAAVTAPVRRKARAWSAAHGGRWVQHRGGRAVAWRRRGLLAGPPTPCPCRPRAAAAAVAVANANAPPPPPGRAHARALVHRRLDLRTAGSFSTRRTEPRSHVHSWRRWWPSGSRG